MNSALIEKYNIPGPRYTSYPTVPYWDDQKFSLKEYKKTVIRSFDESNTEQGISLYIHLPFCESLCTFCGCNKRITKNHQVEIPYIKAVLKEWKLYLDMLDKKPVIKELHLGGGTPTFFSSGNLELLLDGIFGRAVKAKEVEFSFEGHPNNTTEEHLATMAAFGFTRISYGVQDYNEKVQRAIHRIQSFEQVEKATLSARKLGFNSVGHDIIYGLPFQNEQHIIETISKTIELKPSRIAFYSYAHVPWIKGSGQRGFKEEDLPTPSDKRRQYEVGRKSLLEAGYIEIGMDHFALPSDSLYSSLKNNTLHRNFMGYTSSNTQLMISLGVSAIGDSWYGFAQNVKAVEEYQHLLDHDILPIFKGHILTPEDLTLRRHILNIMCHLRTKFTNLEMSSEAFLMIKSNLDEMEKDGLILWEENELLVTEKGRSFCRNVAMAFDFKMQRNKPEKKLFSMTV